MNEKLLIKIISDAGFKGSLLIGDKYGVKLEIIDEEYKDKFPIASITKPMAAYVILKVLEESNLDITSEINKLLPEIPKRITFESLLTHRKQYVWVEEQKVPAGKYADFTSSEQDISKEMSYEQMILGTYLGAKEAFIEDEQMDYNNCNYIIMQKALEKLTGKPFAQILKEYLITPLNLKSTDFYKSTQNGELTRGFCSDGSEAKSIHGSWLGAGGGLYSCLHDLFIFAENSLKRANDIISSEKAGNYSLGWTIYRGQTSTYLGHEGGIDGFSTMLVIDPKTTNIVIMLSNHQFDPIDKLALEIIAKISF